MLRRIAIDFHTLQRGCHGAPHGSGPLPGERGGWRESRWGRGGFFFPGRRPGAAPASLLLQPRACVGPARLPGGIDGPVGTLQRFEPGVEGIDQTEEGGVFFPVARAIGGRCEMGAIDRQRQVAGRHAIGERRRERDAGARLQKTHRIGAAQERGECRKLLVGQPRKNCREEFVGGGAGHRSGRPIPPRKAGCSEGLLEGGSHLGVGDGEGDLIGRYLPRQPSQPADHRLGLAIGIVNDLDLLQRHRDRAGEPSLAHEAPQRIEAGGKILCAQIGRGGDEGL